NLSTADAVSRDLEGDLMVNPNGTKVSFISPYVFSVQVPQDGSGNTLLYTENDAYAAATLPQGSASAVPEPSTLTMACTALLAGIGCWWRRMRRGTAPVAA